MISFCHWQFKIWVEMRRQLFYPATIRLNYLDRLTFQAGCIILCDYAPNKTVKWIRGLDDSMNSTEPVWKWRTFHHKSGAEWRGNARQMKAPANFGPKNASFTHYTRHQRLWGTVWGGNLFKICCYLFSVSSPCLLGQHGNSLWNSQKTLYKTFCTRCRPRV